MQPEPSAGPLPRHTWDAGWLLADFESAWHHGTPPLIEVLVSPLTNELARVDPACRRLLEKWVGIDLEQRRRRRPPGCRAGPASSAFPECPLLEDYLDRCPELGPVERLPVEPIVEEYWVRHCWGDGPNPDEYAARFPRHGASLREALDRRQAELSSRGADPERGWPGDFGESGPSCR